MSSLLSADLAAACNALGYFDAKSNKYYADANTLETVKDLIRYLRRDDESHDIRRQLGESKVLQTDLLPLLKSYWEESDLFDVLLRLIVNLTSPALILWNEELPTEKTARNFYLQIEGHLQSYKEAFADEAVWAVLSTRLSQILELEYAHRGDENSLIIERILIMVRNVLYVPADSMEKRPDNDASIHDQVLWALHQSGMLDIILYITSSANESAYYLHILEILSFMLREQKASELAHAALQRSQTEKVRDEAELLAIRHREINEKQKKTKMFTGTRHSRFGGTFVVKSMKSISDNDLIYHKPLSKLDALNFDVDKTKPKTPKNRLPVKATLAERRSAFSIRLFLKEFCVEFLNGAYNTLMYYVKDNLVRAKAQAHDESYYLWAMRFFMEFNRCYKFEVKLVSETMSVQTFHYVQQQSENYYDMMASDKKKLKLWSRRLHLALLAYRELFLTLSAMDKTPDGTVRDSSKVIKSNIFYVLEYREFILTLLINYDELKMSDAYLKDLIETQHVFLKMLQDFIGKEGSVLVQSKAKKKKAKKRSKKGQNVSRTGPINQELNVDEMWDEASPQLSSTLENGTEFPSDISPFDAASDVPIDDQKADAMKNIQRKLRNGDYEVGIGLLRAAREVWPENDSFGSPNMAPEEEFLALRDIFFADLGENQITVEPEVPDNVPSEEDLDEEDEEEEGIMYNESNFKFEDFSKRLPHPKIVRACGLALKNFDTNSITTNNCIIKLLHRIAFDCKMYVMIFQLGILRSFQKIFQMRDLPQHKELVKFATYIVRQFIKVSETNKKVFMEALFWKSSKECYDVEHGYAEDHGKNSAVARAWTEEQEDELRHLFMEHKESNSQEDVVDWITNNLVDQTKSRRQVLKKLKELMLLVDYKKKGASGKARAPQTWTEDEESHLQELFEQYRESDDPLGNIMNNLDVPRPKNRIVDKLLVMGVIQDKKEVRKKRARKGGKSRPNDSDNDSINNESDSDDDSITSQRSKLAAPPQRRTKKNTSNKSKKTGKQKPTVHVAVPKAQICEILIKIVDSEMHEALEWLKESLSDAIEDYEVENNEGIPLVPVMDYAETAMENPEFQRMLRMLGVCPPFDEQEAYWRIPGHLPISTLQNYCDILQQAIDRTLQVEEEPQSQPAPSSSRHGDDSSDEDVFSKLRKMTKPASPQSSNRGSDHEADDVGRSKIEGDDSRRPDEEAGEDNTNLQESDGDMEQEDIGQASSSVREYENIAEYPGRTKEVTSEGGPENVAAKKRKSRIIQKSDEESDNEDNKGAFSEEDNLGETETNLSRKSAKLLDSDSEQEIEEGGTEEAKRIRSISDSDSDKPAAKRGRIIESDDDDD